MKGVLLFLTLLCMLVFLFPIYIAILTALKPPWRSPTPSWPSPPGCI